VRPGPLRATALTPAAAEMQGCQAALFEWAESVDTKDWARLAACIAPTLRVDYRALLLARLWEAMPAATYVGMVVGLLGDSLLSTQHLFGAARWEKLGDDEIVGHHQVRGAHQRYADASRTVVAVKGHGHTCNTYWYRRVDGEWKVAGVRPDLRWFEYDFDKLFTTPEGVDLADSA
jgi:scytalone dehydratase